MSKESIFPKVSENFHSLAIVSDVVRACDKQHWLVKNNGSLGLSWKAKRCWLWGPYNFGCLLSLVALIMQLTSIVWLPSRRKRWWCARGKWCARCTRRKRCARRSRRKRCARCTRRKRWEEEEQVDGFWSLGVGCLLAPVALGVRCDCEQEKE